MSKNALKLFLVWNQYISYEQFRILPNKYGIYEKIS